MKIKENWEFRFFRAFLYLFLGLLAPLQLLYGENGADKLFLSVIFLLVFSFLCHKILKEWNGRTQKISSWRKRANIIIGIAVVFALIGIMSKMNATIGALILSLTVTALFMLYLNPEKDVKLRAMPFQSDEKALEAQEEAILQTYQTPLKTLLEQVFEAESKLPGSKAGIIQNSMDYLSECEKDGRKLHQAEEKLIKGLLENYLELYDDKIKTAKTKEAINSIRDNFPVIETAFKELYEKKVEELDLEISSSISVLNAKLNRSKFADSFQSEASTEEEIVAES